MYKKYTLDNGLTVLLVPNPTSQAVLVDAFVKTGSRNEDEKIQGISHFLEHLNFKGTKKYPTAKKLSEIVDNIGGDMNAFTTNEVTSFHAYVAAKHIEDAFDVVTELTLHPIFKPGEIEKERGVVIEEINMYLDNPQQHVGFLLQEGMWAEHPFGHNVLGTPETIKSLSRNDIVAYRKRFYVPENIILAVGGKFDEQEVKKLVQKYWGKTVNTNLSHTPQAANEALQKPLIQQTRESNQAHYALGFRSYPISSDPRNHALDVLTAVLSGGLSSRLFTEIREKRGLAYYVYASGSASADTGEFYVKAGVEKNKISEALEVTVKELQKLKKTLIPAKELRKAKEFLKGKTALGLESTGERLAWYLYQQAFKEEMEEPNTWMKRIEGVTPQLIRTVAKEVLRSDNATLAIVGPYDDKRGKELRALVNKL